MTAHKKPLKDLKIMLAAIFVVGMSKKKQEELKLLLDKLRKKMNSDGIDEWKKIADLMKNGDPKANKEMSKFLKVMGKKKQKIKEVEMLLFFAKK